MNNTYAFYIDESGLFQGIGAHVICPLVVSDGAVGMDEMVDIWSRVYPEGWHRFHATDMKKTGAHLQVIEVAENLGRTLFQKDGVRGAYISHQSRQNHGFDFYPGMLFYLLKRQSIHILENTVKALAGNREETFHIRLDIYIAARQPLNTIVLKNLLLEAMSEKIQSMVVKRRLTPGRVHFDFRPFYLPVEDNPFMQVSDLFSNLVRSYLVSGGLSDPIDAVIKQFHHERMSDSQIQSEEIQSACEKLTTYHVGEKILYKTAVKEVEKTRIVSKKQWTDLLIEKFHHLEDAGKEPALDRMGDLFEKYQKLPEDRRRIAFQQLPVLIQRMVREERKYAWAAAVVNVAYGLLEWERRTEMLSNEFLDPLELQLADLFLTAGNHMGLHLTDHPRIRNGSALCEKLKGQMRLWLPISTFKTHLGVASQNIFRFEEAVETLYPFVVYYEQEQKNPFRGADVRAYEIGALFGTYAQSLAFSAHCRFFNEGPDVLGALDDAELYAMLSAEHFEKPEDKERQIIYRAHYQMQKFILAGHETALAEAGQLLADEAENHKAVREFIDAFPERSALTPAYRLAACLKQTYLSQRKPPNWNRDVTECFIKHKTNTPPDHPMEQLLPYLILQNEEPNTKKALHNIFLQLPFPKNIVSVIRDVLLMQINYHMDRTVDDALIKQIHESVTDDIRPQWDRYGLGRVLKSYRKPINRQHVGPMEVLPFNYS